MDIETSGCLLYSHLPHKLQGPVLKSFFTDASYSRITWHKPMKLFPLDIFKDKGLLDLRCLSSRTWFYRHGRDRPVDFHKPAQFQLRQYIFQCRLNPAVDLRKYLRRYL